VRCAPPSSTHSSARVFPKPLHCQREPCGEISLVEADARGPSSWLENLNHVTTHCNADIPSGNHWHTQVFALLEYNPVRGLSLAGVAWELAAQTTTAYPPLAPPQTAQLDVRRQERSRHYSRVVLKPYYRCMPSGVAGFVANYVYGVSGEIRIDEAFSLCLDLLLNPLFQPAFGDDFLYIRR
jgi:hypothetical protein